MKRVLLVLVIIFFGHIASSQITNVRKWRKSEKDSLNLALLMYEENLFLQALPIFENILRNHPNEEFIRYSFAKCGLYRSDTHEEAYGYLSEIYAKNKKVEEIDYDVAVGAHYANKLDEAMSAVDRYLSKRKLTPANRTKGELLKKYITNAMYFVAKPTNAKSTNLGDAVNTSGEEYVPAISADESTLIYTYQGEKSLGGLLNDQGQTDPYGSYHEDIYMARKKDNEFTAAQPLNNINTDANDAAISLSNDGQTLFIYRDNTDDHGDIYESHLVGEEYSQPTKIRGLVNSYSWDGHCSLSPDGKILYFSSERGGGYGGKDIYRASLLADSTWGNIVNLGDSVNTTYDDDAPFIHPDGITLFFSSKGRNSMGGYDVFRSTMNPADSSFKKTENLGYPINSTDDDIYFVLAANGKNAYYSSGKKGGKGLKDIYLLEPNFEGAVPSLYLVKGKVKADSVGVEASIVVEMLSKNNAVFTTVKSNRGTGNYLVSLPAGANYKLTYTYKGMPPQTLTVDASAITGYNEKMNDVLFSAPLVTTPTLATTDSTASALKDTLVANTTNMAGAATATVNNTKTKDAKDGFVPQNKHQEKTMWYVDKYGDIKADSLEFRVQIGAFKNADNIVYPNLDGMGKIQKAPTDEGLTRVTIGGTFKTLRKAFEFNKKIINAGQSDAFVTMIYKGKRVSLEDLESAGIFKIK